MVNRSQDMTVITAPLGGERGRGQVPDHDPGLLAGRQPAAARVRTGRAAGAAR